MGKSIEMLLILAVAVILLLSTELLTGVSSQTSGGASVLAPATDWQRQYGYNGHTGVESATNLIQTSDGGYAYLQSGMTSKYGRFTNIPSGGIVKTDSNNNTQWVKNLKYTGTDGTCLYQIGC